MFWPWMPPPVAAGGGRSSWAGALAAAGAVVVDEPPAGVEVCDCATAAPAAASVSAAAARTSRNLRIVVLPLDGTDLQLRFPAGLVARLPARGHVRPAGALEGSGIGLDARGSLLPLGAAGQGQRGDGEDGGGGSHDFWPP